MGLVPELLEILKWPRLCTFWSDPSTLYSRMAHRSRSTVDWSVLKKGTWTMSSPHYLNMSAVCLHFFNDSSLLTLCINMSKLDMERVRACKRSGLDLTDVMNTSKKVIVGLQFFSLFVVTDSFRSYYIMTVYKLCRSPDKTNKLKIIQRPNL